MTFEQLVADLESAGWRIWNLGNGTRGTWTCRLYHAGIASRVVGQPGPTGYDLPCWSAGTGPTAVAAIGAAARDILQPQMEETLDLAFMLG